jgi:uncharacterized protein YndB with AHSA1/START domain
MKRIGAGLLLALTVAARADADVKQAASDGFVIENQYAIAVAPDVVWRELLHPERWWPSDHTWSGQARNLSLSAEAGGCFCERWDGGAVEHGRVVMATPASLLRINAALGPLQEMAVTGALTVKLDPSSTGTRMTVTYRVSGDSSHHLERLAPVVNDVNKAQFGNLATFVGGTSAQAPEAKPGP